MSSQRRFALIIASDYYADKKLTQLKAPIVDSNRLSKLLQDPSIGGGYEVTILPNKESFIIKKEIERFFKDAQKNDLLLLYFAGHGHKSIDDGLLYLATPDSELEYLDSTTIPAKFINSQIQRSKSSQIVLILDCCYSGAFARDMIARAEDKTLNVKDEFRESGCVVLTSGTAMQFSWEGNLLKKEEQGSTANESSSFYTNFITKGIESGEADLNGDGVIECGELNDYIKNNMREIGHPQKPEIYLLKSDITIAHNKKVIGKESSSSSTSSSSTPWIQAQKERSEYLQKLLENGQIDEFNNLRQNDKQPIYLANIDLSGKILQGINLQEAILPESIFKKAMMKDANLTGAKLTKADLTGADLRSTTFYGAILKEAKLIGADLRGAALKGMVDFTGADLSSADLRGVDLEGVVSFEGAILDDVDFTGSNIDKVLLNFEGAKIKNVKGIKNIPASSNKYSDALKQFSDSISDLFNKYNVSIDNRKTVENLIMQLVKDVKSIPTSVDISESDRISIQTKTNDLIQNIVNVLPLEVLIYNSFTVLSPLNELLDQSKNITINQMVEDVLMQKASDLINKKNFKESLTKLEDIIRINSNNSNAYSNKASILLKMDEKEKALDAVQTALKIDPNNVTALINKGYIIADKGLYNQAIEWFNKAIHLDPKNANAWYEKGNCYRRLGKKQEAKECFKIADEICQNILLPSG